MTSPLTTITSAYKIMIGTDESCLSCIFTPVPKARTDGFCSDMCRDWYNGMLMLDEENHDPR